MSEILYFNEYVAPLVTNILSQQWFVGLKINCKSFTFLSEVKVIYSVSTNELNQKKGNKIL